ncbi:MAG: hemolysin family protein [Firmicutes bacterium]|nr:hemolysin family protein [Bacillota bacterium]MCL2256522.1 hemolysin family protein [Bacillota bacterium]
MEPSHIGILVALVALILLSIFFSLAETSFSTANKVRLRSLEAQGKKRATRVLKALDRYDRIISTVIVGNNIVAIVASSLGTIFFTEVLTIDPAISILISTIVITFLIVSFGEIIPKSIAKEYPETIAMSIHSLVMFFYYILLPISMFFGVLKKLTSKVFRLKNETKLDADELKIYVDTAEKEGGITEDEGNLLRSAIEFDDLDAYDIMTPRVNVIAVSEDATNEEVAEIFFTHSYSRVPVYSGTVDTIIGTIHEKDFIRHQNDEGFTLKKIMTSPLNMPANMKISVALRLMQKAKKLLAVVVDEHGGTSGIVTMEDIIEEIVGEIYDEHDEVEVLTKKVDDNVYIVEGTERLENFFEQIGFETSEEIDATTVGGFVIEMTEKFPVAGERFTFKNLEFRVTKATVKRVVQVKIIVKEEEEEEKEEEN